MSYAELHCLTNFSFLRGASHPEELVERAVELGYAALAMVGVRIVWGLVGPRHARFASFVRGPRATARYARQVVGGRHHARVGVRHRVRRARPGQHREVVGHVAEGDHVGRVHAQA